MHSLPVGMFKLRCSPTATHSTHVVHTTLFQQSQGMTLDQALVNVEKCFAGGQTYVAISRVGPREGLHFATHLGFNRIKTEKTFLEWEALRMEMEQRKAAVLQLLPPAEAPMVEALGLKSLHDYAQRALEGKDSAGNKAVSNSELRRRWALLKNALGKLKPARVQPAEQNRTMVHWQMLSWKPKYYGKRRFSETFQSP